MKKTKVKSFFEMTADERDRQVAKYDRTIDLSKTRPLTKQQRLLHEMVVANPRPRTKVTLEVDVAIKDVADKLAKKRGVSLDRIFELGVKGMAASSGR